MTKNKGGRPTVMTEKVLFKLEEAFEWGVTDVMACLHAGIAEATLYTYIEKNPKFSERKEQLKNAPMLKAKSIVHGELVSGSASQANKVIDRVEGTKVNNVVTGANGGALEWELAVHEVKN